MHRVCTPFFSFLSWFNITAHTAEQSRETICPTGRRHQILRQAAGAQLETSGSSCRLPNSLRHKIKPDQSSSLWVAVRTCQIQTVFLYFRLVLVSRPQFKGLVSDLEAFLLGLPGPGIFDQDLGLQLQKSRSCSFF